MNRNDFYDALYLAHHGIKGQRWGKRNGPPYPLDEEDHSPKEQNQKKGLTDGQKRAIKIGAALAVASLATYGAYKLHQSGALANLGIKKAAELVDIRGNEDGTGFSKPKSLKRSFNTPSDVENVAKMVNPEKGNANCVACSGALCGQMLGEDIVAKGDRPDKKGYPLDKVVECFGEKLVDPFDGTSYISTNREAYDHLTKTLKDQGEGSFGMICTARKIRDALTGKVVIDSNGEPKYSGHEVVYRIMNGNVHFFEGQKDMYNKVTDRSDSREYHDYFEQKFKGSDLSRIRIANLTNGKYDPEKGKEFFNSHT